MRIYKKYPYLNIIVATGFYTFVWGQSYFKLLLAPASQIIILVIVVVKWLKALAFFSVFTKFATFNIAGRVNTLMLQYKSRLQIL